MKAGEPGQIEGQGGRGKEAGARKLDVKAGRGAGLGGVRKCMGHGCWGLAKRISYVRIFHPSKRKRATRLSIHPPHHALFVDHMQAVAGGKVLAIRVSATKASQVSW